MSDLARLTEALNHEQWYYAGPEGHFLDLMNPITKLVHDAARAYRDLLANGERVEPDYEAALHAAESIDWEYLGAESFLSAVESVVDAAIGARLLVDPTTEEER